MLLLEIENVEKCEKGLRARDLDEKYKNVRFTEILTREWGREFMMHAPSGTLWYFGQFK